MAADALKVGLLGGGLTCDRYPSCGEALPGKPHETFEMLDRRAEDAGWSLPDGTGARGWGLCPTHTLEYLDRRQRREGF